MFENMLLFAMGIVTGYLSYNLINDSSSCQNTDELKKKMLYLEYEAKELISLIDQLEKENKKNGK